MSTIATPASLTYVEATDFVSAAAGALARLSSAGGSAPSVGGAGADGVAASGASAAAGARSMEIDLAPLVRFDSSAIAAFVAIERRAVERGVELRFLNAPPNLRKLATLYAVDSLLFGG